MKRSRSSTISSRRLHLIGVVAVYLFATVVFHQVPSTSSGLLPQNPTNRYVIRNILSTSNQTSSNNSSNTSKPRCNTPSIEEFPQDIFGQEKRQSGAIVVHIILAIYMFIALAIVCDDYFVESLEKICEKLDLSEDVAGATFMAAGSSAPELFTAIISVFIAKGDVGVGTIVGSAVFNILVIIALCGLFAGHVVQLSWWPICRDSFCYMLAIAALFVALEDSLITWVESLVMILMYFGYILLMKANPKIVECIDRRRRLQKAIKECSIDMERNDNDHATVREDEETQGRKKSTWKEVALTVMLTSKFPPSTRFRAACLIVLQRERNRKSEAGDNNNEEAAQLMSERDKESNADSKSGEGEENKEEEEECVIYPPKGSLVKTIFWILTLPLILLMYFTIPDCRRSRWERWWPLTFISSIFWIMVFSYLMVWMVCVIGFTIGIPDVIVGVIFLAAGTSIPDAMSSLLVAREGMGDMAVSNSIGSNIFDILIGLAIPWFIKSAIQTPGQGVHINSRGMVYSVALLFGSVILTLFAICCNRWRLDLKLGVFFTIVYVIFITISSLIEFNVFTYVNFPVCAYDG